VSKTRYLVLFAASYYVGALLVTAPASLLDLTLSSLSHGQVSLANAQGTIWHGSATPVLHPDKVTTFALQTLNWQFIPLSLLQGQLKINMGWDSPTTQDNMLLIIKSKSIELNNIQLSIPAEIIGELSPFLKPAQFSGDVMITCPSLTYSDNFFQGNAKAQWSQAGSAMSSIHPLGNYQIDILAANNEIHATLFTQSGALLLDGQGNWSPAKRFQFNGTAHASESAQTSLNELLHHLGPETTPGIYHISL
jgi:general secretion pathway protein N